VVDSGVLARTSNFKTERRDSQAKTYQLLGPDGRFYQSTVKGILGGHKSDRVYGRLDCPAAARALSRGGYRAERVFFADESTAVAAGFRPCAACLPDRYAAWKQLHRQDGRFRG
jgi:hypothetical protein